MKGIDKKILVSLLLIIFTLSVEVSKNRKSVITIVSGLWDIGRGNTTLDFKRNLTTYLGYLQKWVKTQSNLIIYGDSVVKEFIMKYRTKSNTVFIQREVGWFKNKWYAPKVKSVIEYYKKIDQKKFTQFYYKTVQYNIDLYAPIVFSKISMLAEAKMYDIFKSDYIVWMDAGLTQMYNEKLFLPTNVLEKFPIFYPSPFIFHTIQSKDPMDGFQNKGQQYIRKPLNTMHELVLGDYFGGRVEAADTVANIFQNFVKITLQQKELWNEEVLMTLMLQRFPYIVSYVHLSNLTCLKSSEYHSLTHKEQEELPIITYDQYFGQFKHLLLSQQNALKQSLESQPAIVKNKEYDITSQILLLIFLYGSYGLLKWKQLNSKESR